MHPTAEAQLLVIEAGKIVQGGVLHGVVVGEEGLQNYFSRDLATPCATRNLRQQLEGAFRGAKVGKAERHIRANNSNQRDAVDVVALGDHLRADQEIEFAVAERMQGALEVRMAVDSIAIEARNSRLRKISVEQFFELLRSGGEKID